MRKVVLLDTSVATFNKGDEIIMDSARNAVAKLVENDFVITMPTHTPAFHWYQTSRLNAKVGILDSIDLKFVCGTNLLYTNMVRPWAGWNINLFNIRPLRNSILLGVGCGINSKSVNWYTRKLYRSVLSKDYIHSVRDDVAKNMLEELGLKAINTGCPTLWSLTPEHCRSIPTDKSNSVVFTLTDYCKDVKRDQKLIDLLKQNYERIYFWPQGAGDFDYFQTFINRDNIEVIPPSLEAFDKLHRGEIDYVGTRLHGGIFSMKRQKRSIIITVDYRAREMSKSYNINCIERDNLEDLPKVINSSFTTTVNVDFTKINAWLNQFVV